MNISGWVQLQFDCKCFKFSCLKVCWKFQSMLKSVMHVESILKKSVENYKKACWNFQYVLKTVKKHVEISVCSENCKKACWKFQNSSSEVVHSRCTSRFSSTQHSEIFWNIWKLYERYLLQFKWYFTIQMFRIFNFVKFLKRSTSDAHPDDWVWNILEKRSDSLRIVRKLSGKFHFAHVSEFWNIPE